MGPLSSVGPQILAFGSYSTANFQPILDCFIPNFKLTYQDSENIKKDRASRVEYIGEEKVQYYLLTNWLEYLYGRIQSPRPDVMPDRREGITRAAGFVFACIDTQAS